MDIKPIYEENLEIIDVYGNVKLAALRGKTSNAVMYFLLTNTMGIAAQDVALNISTSAAKRILDSNGDEKVIFNELERASALMFPLVTEKKNKGRTL